VTPLDSLATPSLVLDLRRLERNVEHMRTRMETLGVALRPHMKTAKSVDVARLVLDRPDQGVTVSTLAEAEAFSAAGITDILYAVGIAPDKLDRARSCGAQVVVDSVEMARRVVDHGGHRVWIEVDCDGRRAGVDPHGPELIQIGSVLGPVLAGVMTHAGGSYTAGSHDELMAFVTRERWAVVTAAERLRDGGLDCPGVSVGSTPTMASANDLTGVTEARPGVYMFMDLFQAGLGVCAVDDIAISVLATVIGHRSDGAIVDAGALALSLDRTTSFQEVDRGFGLVCDLDCAPLGDLVVDRVTQEHGVILGGRHLPLGSKARILPNHACITAAAHDHYQVVEASEVIDRWDRITGW
jgi:D-serine deaminase-like pyridoxal phosphate-dependent protein